MQSTFDPTYITTYINNIYFPLIVCNIQRTVHETDLTTHINLLCSHDTL